MLLRHNKRNFNHITFTLTVRLLVSNERQNLKKTTEHDQQTREVKRSNVNDGVTAWVFTHLGASPSVGAAILHGELHWLDVLERITYKLAVMVYRCLHGQEPRYLADHLTPASDVASRLRVRSANRQQLLVPCCRLDTYGRRAFFIAGPTVWNSLPDELRDPTRGSDSFRQFLKTILFSFY